jgi:rod shape determining protein RodA
MTKPRFRIFPYRLLPGVDWILIALSVILALLGIMTIWGATSKGNGPGPFDGFALKQAIWFGVSLILMVLMTVMDYRSVKRIVWILYGVMIVALIGLLVKGHSVKGAASWYNFGPIHFEPAEMGKVIVVLTLAHYLAPRILKFRGIRPTLIPLLISGVPMLLILAERALGSALVLGPITISMFWIAGVRKWVLILFFIVGIGGALAVYPHLKPYQQERIKTFIDPQADPQGTGWNILQAQTALGSGELFGKGWGRGTQTNFNFLPESHTDFIFPTVGEQFGMVGCAVVLALFLILISRMVHLANVTQDMFGVLIVTGLTTLLVTHFMMNVGMVVGLLPVAGLPLPFFSYGGSFMMTCMIAIGLTLGIGARRGL